MTDLTINEPKVISLLRSSLSFLGRIELVLAVVLVFFITVVIVVGVFFRYVLGSSLIFVEESVTISFIWVTFLGAAVATKLRRHIVITTFSIFAGNKTKEFIGIFSNVFVLIVAIIVAAFATYYIEPQNRSQTVSLPFNFPRGWVFSIPTLVAMVSISLTQIAYILDSVIRLRHPHRGREPMTILGG